MKKAYNAPKLTVHGDVEVLTQQGGVSSTDVPNGTPVGPDGITSVAS
ncbi:MAG: lasso peptide [Cyanobacteria bacterium J06621_8]